MADKERYVSGPQCVVSLPVASATVIQKGDFIALSSGKAIPTSDLSDVGDAAANREAAADVFVGIALTASDSGETDDIQVDISNEAVFELDLQTADNLSFGDLVEIYSAGSTTSRNSTVAGSTSNVAMCVEDHASASGTSFKAVLTSQLIRAPQT